MNFYLNNKSRNFAMNGICFLNLTGQRPEGVLDPRSEGQASAETIQESFCKQTLRDWS